MNEVMTLEDIELALEKAGVETQEDKVEWLRDRCDELNINFHHKAGYDKLTSLLLEHYNKSEEVVEEQQPTEENQENWEVADLKFTSIDRYVDETETQFKERKRKEASKLIRVRIACMNPMKSEWEGEIFTFANDITTIRRMVPFDVETHVELAILNMIRDRKYQRFANKKKAGLGGVESSTGSLVPEFAIEQLEPLTSAELKQLAHTQQARVQPKD